MTSNPETTESDAVDTADLNKLLNEHFAGRVVRKDLTKRLKDTANVPVYVLEYLLGIYCASDDQRLIDDGMETIKKILAENYVRPDEAEKVKSVIRERGTHKVIDRITVQLNEKRDVYEAVMDNMGLKHVEINTGFVKQYDKLLAGGIWAIVTLQYYYEEGQKGSPFIIKELKPIQMPNLDLEAYREGRRAFTTEQWMDVLMRSTGLEPTLLDEREKWHFLTRIIPLVENNYNSCELGPKQTGKSHVYKEVSPNSILISGGQTTVANLFYNMGRRQVGLVGAWDVVAFDEVAGISFKDRDGIQIMKDYMNSGSFTRGKSEVAAYASMAFVGNIDNVEGLLKTSHLLAPFPEAMIDSAFFDRFHAYIPGWEVPKLKPENFTDQYGLITDYMAEAWREMRKQSFGDAVTKYFRFGRELSQRDTKAVTKSVSGFLKLLAPHGEYDKELVRQCLTYALELRRRVKEQLKRIGGMEFYDVHFSYIDLETDEEIFVGVPEQGGGNLIPDSPLNPGVLHTVAPGSTGHLGLFRLETQVVPGNGQLKISGLGSNTKAKEAVKVGFDFFKANVGGVSGSIKASDHDYHLHMVDLHGVGPTANLTLVAMVAMCSAVMKKPLEPQLVMLGDMSLGGVVNPVDHLAESLQVAMDAGGRRVLMPMASVSKVATIPGELFASFQSAFYSDAKDAAFKAMGVS